LPELLFALAFIITKNKMETTEETKQEEKVIDEFELLIEEKFKTEQQKEEEEKNKQLLIDAYYNIVDLLKEYCDLKEESYNLVALWILGTYFHDRFPSFPYLFFNAMRGSGKSRLMSLVTSLAKDGEMLNSMTEAVLFRTSGTLGIDEFEGVERKGAENLRELLNSCYKKGIKVKRMRKKRVFDGETQVAEEFEVYRPICLANIYGMENVLEDRCITLILEKSSKKEIINLIEIWRFDTKFIETKKILDDLSKKDPKVCSLCSVVMFQNIYKQWNNYIKGVYLNYTNYTYTNNNINYTNYTNLFNELIKTELSGREMELCMPLFLISNFISDETLQQTIDSLKTIFSEKREENFSENWDIMLFDFVSQKLDEGHFEKVNKLTEEFREFTQIKDDDLNSKWVGRALKRLSLVTQKRRKTGGVEVMLNVKKAIEKINVLHK